jgi:hypothetical protein
MDNAQKTLLQIITHYRQNPLDFSKEQVAEKCLSLIGSNVFCVTWNVCKKKNPMKKLLRLFE